MPQKCFWRGVSIVVLCVVLATPIKASGYPSGGGIVAGVVAGLAAVVVTIVVIHRSSQKRTITGCVSSGENGMSVADEKDKQIFVLSGNTASIKSGDRVTLQGKKVKPKGAKTTFSWEVNKETKDFGACQF